MAILVLTIGVVMFLIGIAGQIGLGQRFRKQHSAGDRRSARLVLTLAAIIIGAWLVIISASTLLHKHAQSQHGAAQASAYPSASSTSPNKSSAAVVKIAS